MPVLKMGAVGADVKRWQRFLAAKGFSPGAADGTFGLLTHQATAVFQAAHGLTPDGRVGKRTVAVAEALGFEGFGGTRKFDARSERNLRTLLPQAEAAAREFLAAVLDADIGARIVVGSRTFAEQDALYAQGRTKPGPIVTRARGGQSLHNFGIAWDIGIFDEKGAFLPESPLYEKAGRIGKRLGLEWGGDFEGFVDLPHFQIKTGLTLAQIRQRVKAGKSLFA
jgi:peptidoglycan L-alanyl-D-glutamate endopeptidase CwlK